MVLAAFRPRASRAGTGPCHLGTLPDTLPVAVRTCTIATFRIDDANAGFRKLLKTIRHVLRIDPDWIVGTSIDIFHRKLGHQRRLLTDPGNLPHAARIMVSDGILDLHIDTVRDPAGRYTCATLSQPAVTGRFPRRTSCRPSPCAGLT